MVFAREKRAGCTLGNHFFSYRFIWPKALPVAPGSSIPFQPAEIRRLVKEFGSPLLILDCERVRVQYRKLRKALPGVDLHYALKPMPHPSVVNTIVAEGGFLDLATTGEVHLVERLGVAPERCIHTHPIKREQDIVNAVKFGVRTFVADNPDEVQKFARHTADAELLLRVSFRSPGAVCDLSRKFGCDPEDLLALARLAADLGVSVRGLSFHVGSQAMDSAKHVEALEACTKLMAAARREKLGRSILSTSVVGFPSTTHNRCRTSAASARRCVRHSRSCRSACGSLPNRDALSSGLRLSACRV